MMESDTSSEDSVASVGVFDIYEGTDNEDNSEMMVSEQRLSANQGQGVKPFQFEPEDSDIEVEQEITCEVVEENTANPVPSPPPDRRENKDWQVYFIYLYDGT